RLLGPERRARRVVVAGAVEPSDQARLEGRTAGHARRRATRRVEVLAKGGEAFLPPCEVERGLGDVVAEPLVHVLVVERAQRGAGRAADLAAREGDLALHLLLERGRRRADEDAVGRERPRAVEVLLEGGDVFLVVHGDLVRRLARGRDRVGLRLEVLDAARRARPRGE